MISRSTLAALISIPGALVPDIRPVGRPMIAPPNPHQKHHGKSRGHNGFCRTCRCSYGTDHVCRNRACNKFGTTQ
jgi:hypothetical protein